MQPTDRQPFILSYTYMGYMSCLWKYLQYVMNGYEKHDQDSLAANRGDLCHQIFAGYGGKLHRAGRPKCEPWFHDEIAKTFSLNSTPDWLQSEVLDALGDFPQIWMINPKNPNYFESKMAINRWDWNQVKLNPAAKRYDFHKTAIPQDVICGTADHIEIIGDRAIITDFKSHFKSYSYDDALDNPQLELYAWLLFMHREFLNEITVREWGFRYGARNESGHTWDRETLDARVRPKVIESFAKLDEAWATFGNENWPVQPGMSQCQYCKLVCSRKLELLGRNA